MHLFIWSSFFLGHDFPFLLEIFCNLPKSPSMNTRYLEKPKDNKWNLLLRDLKNILFLF